MSQQQAIIVMIDINAALQANTLEGNTYLFDNMKTHGSTGEGTGDLITAVNGSHWYDGGMAAEQVLNWLPYGVGTLPRTLPRGFQESQSKLKEKNLINEIKKGKNLDALSKKVSNEEGVNRQLKTRHGNINNSDLKMVDVTGKQVNKTDMSAIYMTPIINEITGEAVDKGVIFPDQYGSPDLVNDGWYWAATVNTSITGVFAYTMHITLYRHSPKDNTWTPVEMTYTSYINVSNKPKINGFTQGSMDLLPL